MQLNQVRLPEVICCNCLVPNIPVLGNLQSQSTGRLRRTLIFSCGLLWLLISTCLPAAASDWPELPAAPLSYQPAIAGLNKESPKSEIRIEGQQRLNTAHMNVQTLRLIAGAHWIITPQDKVDAIVIRAHDLYLPARNTNGDNEVFIERAAETEFTQLDGASGAMGLIGASDRPAHTGKDGADGAAGVKGAPGNTIKLPDLYLVVDQIHLDSPNGEAALTIHWDGVRGGNGGAGGAGGNGGDGAQGTDAKCGWFSCEQAPGRGGNGGAGGLGGAGGDAGRGGNGGNVYFVAPRSELPALSAVHLSQEGGASGQWGAAGLPGKPGNPGEPGKQCGACLKYSPLNLLGTLGKLPLPPDGGHGNAAGPGESGTHGFIVKINGS